MSIFKDTGWHSLFDRNNAVTIFQCTTNNVQPRSEFRLHAIHDM